MVERQRVRAALADFDGRATTLLTELAARESGNQGYTDHLVSLVGDTDDAVSDGATWLLKAQLEAGERLDDGQVAEIIAGLDRVTSWASQLHLCQSIQYMRVASKTDARRLADWLDGLLDHKRPFVRAWSVDGLVSLAKQHPTHLAEAKKALARAQSDAAASVRARARNLSLDPAVG